MGKMLNEACGYKKFDDKAAGSELSIHRVTD